MDRNNRIHTLRNGLRIANFSSPHQFSFTDGTVLPAVDSDLAQKLMLETEETEIVSHKENFSTISIRYGLSETVKEELEKWQEVNNKNDIDVVLIPLPVMQCIKEEWGVQSILRSPFRVVRMADRVNKQIFAAKFCV